jgi:hypothetical protein
MKSLPFLLHSYVLLDARQTQSSGVVIGGVPINPYISTPDADVSHLSLPYPANYPDE